MMDALVSNKPEFVRLFVDNGADVADFLTYGRLQQLYRSVAPKSLLFDLLQRKHEEGRLTLAGLGAQQAREPPAGPPAFSLHEVSRVLKDFLHDACRGLYQAVSAAAGARAWGGRRRERGRECGRSGEWGGGGWGCGRRLTHLPSRSGARPGGPRARRGCWT